MTPELAPPLKPASEKDREWALGLYLVLAALFVASLVTCNLIFRKFFFWTMPGMGYTFEASVGLLPYPLTFLVTDLISEIFGKKRADDVVKGGLFASVFTLVIITMAGYAPATEWSPVNNGEFDHVFGQTVLAVGASMAAYLIAQFLDVRIFHFWKHRTGGRMLWLRNNFSTIPSQFADTIVVLVLHYQYTHQNFHPSLDKLPDAVFEYVPSTILVWANPWLQIRHQVDALLYLQLRLLLLD